jgi:hypothetical protein
LATDVPEPSRLASHPRQILSDPASPSIPPSPSSSPNLPPSTSRFPHSFTTSSTSLYTTKPIVTKSAQQKHSNLLSPPPAFSNHHRRNRKGWEIKLVQAQILNRPIGVDPGQDECMYSCFNFNVSRFTSRLEYLLLLLNFYIEPNSTQPHNITFPKVTLVETLHTN